MARCLCFAAALSVASWFGATASVAGERAPANEITWPFAAIARVDVPGRGDGGQCTGTLIGRDVVVTAAHCVVGPHGRVARKIRVSFRTPQGFRTYAPRSVKVAPGFRPRSAWSMLERDFALLALHRSPDVKAIPIASVDSATLAGLSRAGNVVRAGWGSGSRQVLTIHRRCLVQESTKEPGVMLNECYSAPGNSGSPILLLRGSHAELVALHTAIGRHDWFDNAGGTPKTLWVGAGPAGSALLASE